MIRSRTPTDRGPCPYCGAACKPDAVDVGIGILSIGPLACECGASEVWAMDEAAVRSKEDPGTGWYRPGQGPERWVHVMKAVRKGA